MKQLFLQTLIALILILLLVPICALALLTFTFKFPLDVVMHAATKLAEYGIKTIQQGEN